MKGIRTPFTGGKVGGLTLALDNLSHELGILFIISTGNISNQEIKEKLDNQKRYPNYLLEDCNLLEPANSMNSITVGSIAKYDASRSSERYSHDPAYSSIAPVDSISPFSRTGLGIGNSIKPDLVAYGGNLGYDRRTQNIIQNGLGIISLNSKFLSQNLFSENFGTSFSAPYISYLAGRILSSSKDFSSTLLKALLVANASHDYIKIPFERETEEKLKLVGYGNPDEEFLFRSSEEVVILFSTELIENNKNHFYELPIPDEFFEGKKRKREISVTLSYNSASRNTRVNYRATRISYKFLTARSMSEVMKNFNKSTKKEDYENIPEYSTNRFVTSNMRNNGNLQKSTWEFKKPKKSKLFLVVTRNDFSWGEKISKKKEEYSLVIAIKDKEAREANLYTKIKEKIKIREKAKA